MNNRGYGKGSNIWLALVSISILALVLAGCAGLSGAAQTGSTVATSAPAPTAEVAPTTAAAAATEMPTAVPAPTTATTMPVTSAATVMISQSDTLGDIVTDDKGMALYLFTKDTPNTSNCYDQCAVNWPPLLTSGAPMVRAGADASLLGTTARKDGTTQVTYNGWPLYYWVKDQKPGDTTGQDVGGVWFVLSAKGEQVATPAAGASTSDAAAGKTVNVSIKDFSFGQPLSVPVGTTVVWTNEDSAPHTVSAGDDSFDSGTMNTGDTFSFTFTKAGTFDYICKFHPNMKGTVTVTG